MAIRFYVRIRLLTTTVVYVFTSKNINNIKYRVLDELNCCRDHEILWLYLRPTRLPKGVSCLVVAVVYHPPPSWG